MRFEVQRLLLRETTAPAVVDVAAILRAVAEVDPEDETALWGRTGLMLELASIHELTPRQLVWFIGRNALPSNVLSADALEVAHRSLVGALPRTAVIRSKEPLGGALAALRSPSSATTLVTAGLERHSYELHALTMVDDVLDIETGRRWSRDDVRLEFGVDPSQLPRLCAATGGQPYWPCPARPRADLTKYTRSFAQALAAGRDIDADVPTTVREKVQWARPRIEELAHRMKGLAAPDPNARAQLDRGLNVPAATTSPRTAYVCANVDTATQQIRSVEVSVGNVGRAAHGDGASRALLAEVYTLVSERWFVPRALDLLAALAERGQPMPERVVDPGLVNYVFNTEEHLDLAKYSPTARLLNDEQLTWLTDVLRETSAPAITGVAQRLPAVDQELRDLLTQENLLDLVENDLGPTLPVLARIERRGARVGTPGGFPNWEVFDAAVAARIVALERQLASVLGGLDPYGRLEPLVGRLAAHQPLSADDRDVCPKAKDRLERLAARGSAASTALLELRSLDNTIAYWRPLLIEGSDLRGRWTPQRTGRWGLRNPPLTSLPKNKWVGDAIRGAFLPPPGYGLVVADYNAFEGRLLAAASNDPLLIKACNAPDFHAHLAQRMFGKQDGEARGWTKGVLYAMAYGQTLKGFASDHHKLTPAEARRVFRRVQRQLRTAQDFRRARRVEYKNNKAHPVRTPGGWQRFAVTWRQMFNTGIQAYSADIFRWVIRRLDAELRPHDAVIVHQMHDEVFVTAPERAVLDVAALVKRVMEDDVRGSELLPSEVRLVADVTVRTSWREP